MTKLNKTILAIDGNKFSDFETFVAEVSVKIFDDDKTWSGSLDQLNDMLRGGYGTPDEPFSVRWVNSKKSQTHLGHEAMLEWLVGHRKVVHPSNMAMWEKRIELAQNGEGETLFLKIVDIIVSQPDIVLILE
jgi:RNAse (barnase) inhibitor barstar